MFTKIFNESQTRPYFSRMKKILFPFFILFLIVSINVCAQQPPPPLAPGLMQWFPGWYISSQGDTVKGKIFLSNQIDNQSAFKFSTDPQHATVSDFNTATSKGYLVKDRLYRKYNLMLDNSMQTLFLRCIQDGDVCLYAYCSLPNVAIQDGIYTRQVGNTDEKFQDVKWIVTKSSGDPIVVPDGKKFIELMQQLMSDNTELVNKIATKQKGYRQSDIAMIILEYDNWKKSAHNKVMNEEMK